MPDIIIETTKESYLENLKFQVLVPVTKTGNSAIQPCYIWQLLFFSLNVYLLNSNYQMHMYIHS